MNRLSHIFQRFHSKVDAHRLELSRQDALLQLSLLGLLTGIAAGLVISLFRWVIDQGQLALLPGSDMENYEALSVYWRIAIPAAGGLMIGAIFHLFSGGSNVVGIVHVMERLSYHQGYLTLRATILQFIGAALAIISGHSVGREGPAVHLGAASGSLLGQYLALPNNVIRTLVGCGTAAAISASFNTPLAGVIFALEVIMLDYTLASFTPIILAAVSADAVSIFFFGSESIIQSPAMVLNSLTELSIVLVLGLIIGITSSGFIATLQTTATRFSHLPFWVRTTLAGIIVGICAAPFPEIMGMGYDTMNDALLGKLGLGILLGITLFKLFASATAVGLGIPGGLIGPTLVIGATMGGAVGVIAVNLFPETATNSGFYALLGLGAMMGATLQAPLAALVAMMELTHSPAIILPGMLAIVVANLTTSEVFRQRSIFITLLRARGLDYKNDPVTQALRRQGVATSMERNFTELHSTLDRGSCEEALKDSPNWILIKQEADYKALMPAVDLARHLQESSGEEIDLLQIPATRYEVIAIDLNATLQEARETLDNHQAEALYVHRMNAPAIYKVYGVLTREQIEAAYRY